MNVFLTRKGFNAGEPSASREAKDAVRVRGEQIHYLSRHDVSHWLDVQHVRSTSLRMYLSLIKGSLVL